MLNLSVFILFVVGNTGVVESAIPVGAAALVAEAASEPIKVLTCSTVMSFPLYKQVLFLKNYLMKPI